MQVLPTIYKRDSKGQVREWRMEIEGDKYRTVAGLQDGQQVTSEWTVAEPKNIGRKNETTGEEQAQAEVASHYTKKLDVDYHKNIEDIDTPKIFKPMLAAKWEDRASKIDYSDPVFIQPKLDGIRCIVTRHGAFSRTGKSIVAIPHILEMLAPVFEEDSDVVIDGELYNHELKNDFNQIVSMVRREKLKPEDLELSARMVQYHVYDLPSMMHSPFSERLDGLIERCYGSKFGGVIEVVNTREVASQDEVDESYGHYIQQGYEGGIIRLNGEYEQKRSKQLLKRKDFDDDEFKILAIEEGKGNWSGCAKKLYIITAEGHECEATIQGSMDYCRHVLANSDSYIGKMATVRFFGYTPDGALRFPVAKVLHEDERW